MKVLHQIGWLPNWNLDAHYKNNIGDGFVFCIFNYAEGAFKERYFDKIDGLLDKSFMDLQYFGKRESAEIKKGKLKTYPFHPAANESNDATNVYLVNSIIEGVKYQVNLGLGNIIIPNYYENDHDIDSFIGLIKTINVWLRDNRTDGCKYFMTIPITNHMVIDADKVEKILRCLTDMKIGFDGYYIVCESKPDYKQKISLDYKYLVNLSRIFEVLKSQKFTTIYAYANWDALLFLATTDIDYITIGTYENLRSFSINRFIKNDDGGPSKGWYFSEKLLNFVKAQQLDLVRSQGGISLIRNEKNIFSDDILNPNYPWSNQKPEVHKNYLMAVDRLLKDVASVRDLKQRKDFVVQKINNAIDVYEHLQELNIELTDESKNYHLETWRSYLKTK